MKTDRKKLHTTCTNDTKAWRKEKGLRMRLGIYGRGQPCPRVKTSSLLCLVPSHSLRSCPPCLPESHHAYLSPTIDGAVVDNHLVNLPEFTEILILSQHLRIGQSRRETNHKHKILLYNSERGEGEREILRPLSHTYRCTSTQSHT